MIVVLNTLNWGWAVNNCEFFDYFEKLHSEFIFYKTILEHCAILSVTRYNVLINPHDISHVTYASMTYDLCTMTSMTYDLCCRRSGSERLWVVTWGIRKLLVWIKDHYGNPEVLTTENGVSDIPAEQGSLQDHFREVFYREYINNVHK